jgi:hypothetical protein
MSYFSERAAGFLKALCLSVVLSAASNAAAQLPAARLLHIFPPGGQAGSNVDATVTGTDLDGISGLRFSHPGLRATSHPSNRFSVEIAKDVPPGIYELRAMGKHGASNPRLFAVGTLAELRKDKTSADAPQTVQLGHTINGRTDANTVDYFRFEARAGQRVLVRCDTRTLDSKLDPVLSLHDAQGQEMVRSRAGGLLETFISADGEFTVRLHDLTYRGGPEFFYRLSIGTFPHVDSMRPRPGKPPGSTHFELLGRNLSERIVGGKKQTASPERVEMDVSDNSAGWMKLKPEMPAQHALDLREYYFRTEAGVSEGVLFRLPTEPTVLDVPENDSPDRAQPLSPPCEVTGVFSAKARRHFFSFQAKKGDVFWLEVLSHRLGQPTDPFLLVQRRGTNGTSETLELNDSEANVGGAEFNTTHRDPSGRFEARQDGEYLVQLRDLFTRPGQSLALPFQLIIRKPAPGFRLVALPVTPPPPKKDGKDVGVGVLTARRDEVVPMKVIALRRDGFTGPIELTAADLPKGLSAAPARIDTGKNTTLVFLHAAAGCPPMVEAVKVRGRAEIDGREQIYDASAVTLVSHVTDPATEAVLSRGTSELVVSTAEDLFPIRLAAAEDKTWEAVAGSKLKIPLQLSVDGELSGPLKLKPAGPAALEAIKEFDLDPKTTNAVFEIEPGRDKIAPGTYSFTLAGSAGWKAAGKGDKKPKEVNLPVYSQPITLKVMPPPAAKTNSPAK